MDTSIDCCSHNPDQKSYVGSCAGQLQKEKSNWLGMLPSAKPVVTGLPFAHDTWRIGQEEMSRFSSGFI